MKTLLTATVTALLVILSVTPPCIGQELLNPFISWSNNDLLKNIPQEDDVHKLTMELSRREMGKVDVVLIFLSKQLSFDHIARTGDIFTHSTTNTTNTPSRSSHNSPSTDRSGFIKLKEAVESSHSHYWTGYKSVGVDWIAELATTMGLEVDFISIEDGMSLKMVPPDKWKGVVVIDLLSNDMEGVIEGDTIRSVMNEIKEVKLSYLAIYTSLNEITKNTQTPRSVPYSNSQSSFTGTDDDGFPYSSSYSSSCPIGGVLNSTNSSTGGPCLLFCLKRNVTFIPNVTNPDIKCSLRVPYAISWCCDASNEQNVTSTECKNETNPSVTLGYVVENITSSSDENICDKRMFYSPLFPRRPEAPRFEEAKPQVVVTLKFIFESNSTNSHSWNILINATYSYKWLSEEVEPENENEPPEDKKNQGIMTYSSFTYRQKEDQNLFLPFAINFGLSYSCSSEEFNTYTVGDNYSMNASTVILSGLQVQPFNVSSSQFASSDDCVGYFTITTWMGVVTMGTLILIFYVAIIAAFSITSIDQFEDSRVETIKVEKLH